MGKAIAGASLLSQSDRCRLPGAMFPSPWDRGRVEKEERFGKKVEEPRPLKKGNHAKPISGLGRRSALGGPVSLRRGHFGDGVIPEAV